LAEEGGGDPPDRARRAAPERPGHPEGAGDPRRRATRADPWVAAGLCLLWVAVAAAIHPVGDFPLNDDWAFGLPVRALLEQGELRLTDWQGMPLVAQIGWGALFCLPAGFSFTALRVSTLVLGGCAGVGLYLLLRCFGAARELAALGAAALLANPIYLVLSNSFMTDVPFLALSIGSVLCLVRGLEEDRSGLLALGIGLAGVSTLVRQLGLAIPLAFALATLPRLGLSRDWWTRAALPVALVAGLLWGWNAVLVAIDEMPALYHAKWDELTEGTSQALQGQPGALLKPIGRGAKLALYSGLFALPLAIALLPAQLAALGRARGRRVALGGAALASLLSGGLIAAGHAIPLGNVLLDLGAGPRTLPGASPPGASPLLWWVVNLAAAIGAAGLLVPIARCALDGSRRLARREALGALWRPLFLGILVVLSFGPIALAQGVIFDRYFLFFTPWLLGLALCEAPPAPSRRALAAGLAVASLFCAFGIGATHDYLAWNGARWEAGSFLLGQPGVRLEDVDGGFEWNNYQALRGGRGWRGERSAAVDRSAAPFAIAFAPSPGDEVLASFEVRAWLPCAATRIAALRRAPGIPPP
jgi:hypothetical protein